jgi:DNA-binding transcriptional LysR family regulator
MDSLGLDTFLAVARHGTVTAAARELCTVQSNVTARLKQLEADLGAELFERHSRGMTLSPAGARLLPYAQRLNALSTEAIDAVQGSVGAHGSLRIGSMESTAALRLPAVLGQLRRRHPDLQIEVRTGPTAELLDHVLARRLDGALVAGPVNHPALATQPVFREELVLVSARDATGMAQRLERRTLTAIVFRQGCSYRQRLETEFARRGWIPYQRLEFGTVDGILGCVAADVGVTLLPRAMVEGHAARKSLRVERLNPKLLVDTLLVRRTDAPPGAGLKALEGTLLPARERRTSSTPVS